MADFRGKSSNYWRENLTDEQYRIMRQGGTEAPFTGKYVHNTKEGMYQCAACGEDLFSSNAKYDSESGWPSFYDVVSQGNVELTQDISGGMVRTEVKCKNCGSHLGHVFNDGPKPTGLRYCINSACLNFQEKK